MSRAPLVRPAWAGIPLRVLLLTVLFTLLGFAVSLFLGIVGTIVYSLLARSAPNLPFAYRHIALPIALLVGGAALVVSLVAEIRRYLRKKAAQQDGEARLPLAAPRIAIPVPHSGDREYAERALPQYEEAVRLAGGEPVRVALDLEPARVRELACACDGVLLPGSRADVDPGKYKAQRDPCTNAADPGRDGVDELLLEDAYKSRKPVLAICYGLQTLNVYRSGTLVQHIESSINHSAGRAVPNAHAVHIETGSQLAAIVGADGRTPIPVNSSHHQSADAVGDGLRVVARSPADGVIEALEGTQPDHFVLAVQWHPERSVHDGGEVAGSAKAIFSAFVKAARRRTGNR